MKQIEQVLTYHSFEKELKNMAVSCIGLKENTAKKKVSEIMRKYDEIISYSKEEKSETSHFVNSFTKSYSLPDDVKEKDVEGKVENGILELTLPIDKKKPLERIISLN